MSNRWLSVVVAVGLLTSLGCETAFGIGADQLVGTWRQSNRENFGYGDFRMVFTRTGEFSAELKQHALYPGQGYGELSLFIRTEGTYRADDGRLILTAKRLTTWDRGYGAKSPAVVQEPYPYGNYLDNARYARTGPLLILDYLSYPADGPVPTTMVLVPD